MSPDSPAEATPPAVPLAALATAGTTAAPTLSSQDIPPSAETGLKPSSPPPADGGATPLQRLTAVELRNYRAYRGSFRIEMPKGENLLLYGENGGGKSSFYHTLRVFLEAPDWMVTDTATNKSRPVTVVDHRHRFISDPPLVKLEFGPATFEWSEATNDTRKGPIRLVNQGKGFLDYKALLDVHHVPLDDGKSIDLFELLIRRLLPYYTYSHRGGNVQFQASWQDLRRTVRERWRRKSTGERFEEDLAAFNESMERAVRDLGKRASLLLATFGDEFGTEFVFEKAKLVWDPRR